MAREQGGRNNEWTHRGAPAGDAPRSGGQSGWGGALRGAGAAPDHSHRVLSSPSNQPGTRSSSWGRAWF